MSRDINLLLIASRGVRAYVWHKGRISLQRAFDETDADLRAFATYMKTQHKTPFRIIVDLPDENFRMETIPPTGGADRRVLIGRRLAQASPASPYAMAIPLGQESTARGDEKILLASLTNPALLAPWLRCCEEAGTLVESLLSPPLLLSRIAAHTGGCEGRYLVFTLGEGGLRQTCFEDGQLQFSRLTGHHDLPPLDIVATCRAESERVRHYESGSNRRFGDTKSYVLLSGHDAELAVTSDDEGNDSLYVIDLSQLNAAHGIPVAPPEISPFDHLLLHLLARGPIETGFAPAEITRPMRLRRWRHLIWATAATLCIGTFTLAASYGIRSHDLRGETKHLQAVNETMRQQWQAHLNARPPLPAAPDVLRELNARFKEMEQQTKTPDATYLLVSRALERMPEMALERIDWRLVPPSDRTPGRPNHASTVTVLDLRLAESGEESAAAEIFAASLRRQENVEADVLPPTTGSDEAQNQRTNAPFSVRLTQTGDDRR